MKEKFLEFLKSPCPETYLAVRVALISSDQYDPYSSELVEVEDLLTAGKNEEAGRMISKAMPNLLLSPRAHLIMSFIAEKFDNEQEAEGERMVASLLVEGIISTGAGTKEQPYLVVRSSDEYDVVQYTGKKANDQKLVHDDDRHLDHVVCDDSSEIWFDISDAFGKLKHEFGDGVEGINGSGGREN